MITARAHYFDGRNEVPLDIGYGQLQAFFGMMNHRNEKKLHKVFEIISQPDLYSYKIFDGLKENRVYTTEKLPDTFTAYTLRRRRFVEVEAEVITCREVQYPGYGVRFDTDNLTLGFGNIYIPFGELQWKSTATVA